MKQFEIIQMEYEREDKFKPIKELFIDYFEQEASKINSDFNYVSCRAYAHFPPNHYEVGEGFFNMVIDCLLKNATYDKTDNLALEIEAFDKNDKLTINADICWGYPYSKTEAEVYEEPVEVTEQTIAIIQEKLPSLVSKLRELIRDNPNGI